MAILLRTALNASQVRATAKATKDGLQVRRVLALAAIHDGGTRGEAARIDGAMLQVVRDWVTKFNAHGPAGLVDHQAPGRPTRLHNAHRAAAAARIELLKRAAPSA